MFQDLRVPISKGLTIEYFFRQCMNTFIYVLVLFYKIFNNCNYLTICHLQNLSIITVYFTLTVTVKLTAFHASVTSCNMLPLHFLHSWPISTNFKNVYTYIVCYIMNLMFDMETCYLTGPKGEKGNSGITGSPGTQGAPGIPGEKVRSRV